MAQEQEQISERGQTAKFSPFDEAHTSEQLDSAMDGQASTPMFAQLSAKEKFLLEKQQKKALVQKMMQDQQQSTTEGKSAGPRNARSTTPGAGKHSFKNAAKKNEESKEKMLQQLPSHRANERHHGGQLPNEFDGNMEDSDRNQPLNAAAGRRGPGSTSPAKSPHSLSNKFPGLGGESGPLPNSAAAAALAKQNSFARASEIKAEKLLDKEFKQLAQHVQTVQQT